MGAPWGANQWLICLLLGLLALGLLARPTGHIYHSYSPAHFAGQTEATWLHLIEKWGPGLGQEEGQPTGWAPCQCLPHRHPCNHQAELANINILLFASDLYYEKKYIQKELRVLCPTPHCLYSLSPETTLVRTACISFSSCVHTWIYSCGSIKHYVVLVYVALNLHKLYLNKLFCLGILYILIIHLHFLYFNCSHTCNLVPYSLYPVSSDGHVAQVFFQLYINLFFISSA